MSDNENGGGKADTAWFTGNVLAHGGPLKHYLLGVLKSEQDAEDAVQETYLKLLTVNNPEAIDKPKAFVFRVAHNLVVSKLRKKRTAATDSVADLERLGVLDETALPDEQLIARQRLRALNTAIDQLPPTCRRVFIMRKVHGLTHQEIAKNLGISRSSVEKHIAKGLKRCKEHLRLHDHDGLWDSDAPGEGGTAAGYKERRS